MHFALLLLLCSLISVSTKTVELHPATRKEAYDLRPGEIVGVRPKDFHDGYEGDNDDLHAAVFVAIDARGIVKVVVISRHFKTYYVPPHLRGDVDKYFLYPTKIDVLKCSDTKILEGELDLSTYRQLDRRDIYVADLRKIMSKHKFRKMIQKIDLNMNNRGIMPPDWKPKETKYIPPKDRKDGPKSRTLDTIEKGEVVHIKPRSRNPSETVTPYLAIFVSWTGSGMLAVVPISEKNRQARETAELTNYDFIPNRKVKGAHGESVSLDGVISLDYYKIVPISCVIFHWEDKTVMTDKSYRKLREAIDSNCGQKGGDGGSSRGRLDDVRSLVGTASRGRGANAKPGYGTTHGAQAVSSTWRASKDPSE